MRRIAVFDVCWTLYRANTTADFVEVFHRERGGLLGRSVCALVRRRWSPVRYLLLALARLTGQDLPRAVLIATLRGQDETVLRDAAARYVDARLVSLRIAPTHALLEARRAAGDDIILLSSSLDVVVAAIARRLDSAFAASELAFEGGRSSGRLARDMTGRKHEALAAMTTLAAPRRLLVCSDNWTDRRLFDEADERYVVVHGGNLHKDLEGLDAQFLPVD